MPTLTIGADDWSALGLAPAVGVTFRFARVNVDASTGRVLSAAPWNVTLDSSGAATTQIPASVNGNGIAIDANLQGWRRIVVAAYPNSALTLAQLLTSYMVDPATLAPAVAPAAWWVALNNAIISGGGGGGAVSSVNTQVGAVVLTQDNIADGSTAKQYTQAEKTKLAGIASGATNNTLVIGTAAGTAADAAALASGLAGKANAVHTHAQSDITNLTSDLAAKYVKPGSGIPSTDLTTAVQNSLGKADSALQSAPVASVAGKTGAVTLAKADVGLGSVDNTADSAKPVSAAQQSALDAKAPLASPALTGVPLAPTANTGTSTTQIATTAFVQGAVSAGTAGVASVNTRTGAVTLTADDTPDGTTNKAYTASEKTKLAGVATGATVNSTDATLLNRANHTGTQLASTISDFSTAADARVTAAALAPLSSPTFTGTPSAPTPTAGDNTTKVATTAFVTSAASTKANLASPTLTGVPAAPTAAAGTNTTQLATTAFVTTADNLKANLASPALTGTPTAPTAAALTSNTQIATTAYADTAVTNGALVSINAQTASYALVLGDANKAVEITSSSAATVTVPLNSSVAFPVGTVIEVDRLGSGSVTIAATGGVTLRYASASLALRTQYSAATIRKQATDTWLVTGDLN